jgi:hypothetical protein
MNVEVVSWISARNHVLSGVFQFSVFLCYFFYIHAPSSPQPAHKRRAWLLLCYVFFVLSLFAKVISVVVPLGLVLSIICGPAVKPFLLNYLGVEALGYGRGWIGLSHK